jgi:glycosyltransferase involved in cell wall biosynthesis
LVGETEHIPALSIVIAAYNSAPWLPSTLDSLIVALRRSSTDAEIVVVDDGSTDSTAVVLAEFAATAPVPVRIVSQPNKGRFLARWEGLQAARAPRLFIFDSRLVLDPDAFAYLESVDPSLPAGQVWNGHVPTDPSAPLVGRFWEVPTHLFWGAYLAHPKPTEITAANFDRLPKGTGCLVIDRELFESACLAAWPEENADLVSDDTKVLRFVADRRPLRLDPGFSATYRPRISVPSFLSHAYDRGTLFVDSYAGTSLLRNAVLIGLVVMPIVLLGLFGLAVAAGAGWAIVLILALVVLGLVLPAVASALRGCAPRAVASYLSFVVPFGVVFWAGVGRGIVIHRRSFLRAKPASRAD